MNHSPLPVTFYASSGSQNGDCHTTQTHRNSTKRQNNKKTQISVLSKLNVAKLSEKFPVPCGFWIFWMWPLHIHTLGLNQFYFYVNTDTLANISSTFIPPTEAFCGNSLFSVCSLCRSTTYGCNFLQQRGSYCLRERDSPLSHRCHLCDFCASPLHSLLYLREKPT